MEKIGSFILFRGINAITIDSKGRIAMPTRHRDVLLQSGNHRLVMTIDTDSPCLLLYPIMEWEIIEQKIQALPSFNKAARRIQRLLIGHATEIDMDNSGRLLVPPLLREYANLDKNIMLIGQSKKFELWDENIWNKNRESWLKEEEKSSTDLPTDLQFLAL